MKLLKTIISYLPIWFITSVLFLTAFSQQKNQIIISADVENANIQFAVGEIKWLLLLKGIGVQQGERNNVD